MTLPPLSGVRDTRHPTGSEIANDGEDVEGINIVTVEIVVLRRRNPGWTYRDVMRGRGLRGNHQWEWQSPVGVDVLANAAVVQLGECLVHLVRDGVDGGRSGIGPSR